MTRNSTAHGRAVVEGRPPKLDGSTTTRPPQQQEAATQEQTKLAQSKAEANKGSPDKAAGKLSMDQMLAELDARPKMPSR